MFRHFVMHHRAIHVPLDMIVVALQSAPFNNSLFSALLAPPTKTFEFLSELLGYLLIDEIQESVTKIGIFLEVDG